MKLYEYKSCSTCRKARNFLQERGVEYESIDISSKAPSVKELQQGLQACEGQLKKLFNTSGVLYREMGLKDTLADLSEREALELLAQHGKLVKRPFALVGDEALIGFQEDRWRQVLG